MTAATGLSASTRFNTDVLKRQPKILTLVECQHGCLLVPRMKACQTSDMSRYSHLILVGKTTLVSAMLSAIITVSCPMGMKCPGGRSEKERKWKTGEMDPQEHLSRMKGLHFPSDGLLRGRSLVNLNFELWHTLISCMFTMHRPFVCDLWFTTSHTNTTWD